MTKRPQTTGTRAAIYCRISEDRLGAGEGVERQQSACEKLAAERGLEVVGVFVDNDVSAMHGVRPQYVAMLDAVKRGQVDVIVVLRTDRLYRRLSDLVALTEALTSTAVYSVASGDVDLSSADGRLRANIMGAVSQHESEVKGERVADAAQQRASKGRFNGGARRFGYRHQSTRSVFTHRDGITTETERPSGPLEVVPEEADAIRWAYSHVLRGGSLESVKREWGSRGLVGPLGAPFTGASIRDVLLRPMNAGLTAYKGELLAATSQAPALVDADTWHAVSAILRDPARRTTVGRPAKTLLAPVLRCAVCLADPEAHGPGRMSGRSRTRGNASKDWIYECREGHVSRIRSKLDAAISDLVVGRVIQNAGRIQRPAVPVKGEASAVAVAEAGLLERLAGYQARAADMHPDDFAAATGAIRRQLAEINRRRVVTSGTPAASALASSEDIGATWAAMSADDRRPVIKEIIERVEVGRGVSGARDKTMENVVVHWVTLGDPTA